MLEEDLCQITNVCVRHIARRHLLIEDRAGKSLFLPYTLLKENTQRVAYILAILVLQMQACICKDRLQRAEVVPLDVRAVLNAAMGSECSPRHVIALGRREFRILQTPLGDPHILPSDTEPLCLESSVARQDLHHGKVVVLCRQFEGLEQIVMAQACVPQHLRHALMVAFRRSRLQQTILDGQVLDIGLRNKLTLGKAIENTGRLRKALRHEVAYLVHGGKKGGGKQRRVD